MLLSTHTIPLPFSVSLIKHFNKEVVVYGIQVKDIDFRDHLSPEKDSLDRFAGVGI